MVTGKIAAGAAVREMPPEMPAALLLYFPIETELLRSGHTDWQLNTLKKLPTGFSLFRCGWDAICTERGNALWYLLDSRSAEMFWRACR